MKEKEAIEFPINNRNKNLMFFFHSFFSKRHFYIRIKNSAGQAGTEVYIMT